MHVEIALEWYSCTANYPHRGSQRTAAFQKPFSCKTSYSRNLHNLLRCSGGCLHQRSWTRNHLKHGFDPSRRTYSRTQDICSQTESHRKQPLNQYQNTSIGESGCHRTIQKKKYIGTTCLYKFNRTSSAKSPRPNNA